MIKAFNIIHTNKRNRRIWWNTNKHTWYANGPWEAMEAWKMTYCRSVSVQTISNMSLGRSMHCTFTTEYPFSLHLSIDTTILLSSSSTSFVQPTEENEGLDGLDGPSKCRLANISWWSRRSVRLIDLLHPRNLVLTPLWSLLGVVEGWRTVERWSSMVASLLGSSILIRDIGDTGKARVMTPGMGLDNVASLLSKNSWNLWEQPGPIDPYHFYSCAFARRFSFDGVCGTVRLSGILKTPPCIDGLQKEDELSE